MVVFYVTNEIFRFLPSFKTREESSTPKLSSHRHFHVYKKVGEIGESGIRQVIAWIKATVILEKKHLHTYLSNFFKKFLRKTLRFTNKLNYYLITGQFYN